jgi:hypothetical protein
MAETIAPQKLWRKLLPPKSYGETIADYKFTRSLFWRWIKIEAKNASVAVPSKIGSQFPS